MSFSDMFLATYEMAMQSCLEDFAALLVSEPDTRSWLRKRIGHSFGFLVVDVNMPPFWLLLEITAQGLMCSSQFASPLELCRAGWPDKSVLVGTEELSVASAPQWMQSAVTCKPTK